MFLDGAKNDLTGRKIQDNLTINYILKLHNEVRSKIALGRCEQPIAGCMKPLVSLDVFIFISEGLLHKPYLIIVLS